MSRRQRLMKTLGIITASASAVGLVPGVVMLGLNGKITRGGCGAKKCIYETATAGGVLTGLGAAVLVAGGAMLLYAYLPRKAGAGADLGKADRGPALRFGAAPLYGGGWIQLEGRF